MNRIERAKRARGPVATTASPLVSIDKAESMGGSVTGGIMPALELTIAPMQTNAQQVEQAISALEAQRAVLGDAVVDGAQQLLRAKLAGLQDDPAAQNLRLVSVLFLDVVGSTNLSRQLEPEEILEVMDGSLAIFTQVVNRHGGRVLQYAGDSVLAAFGADEVHEDDAERAVLAGLALVREGRVQAEWIKANFGFDGFDVRVGISSGPVLIGGGIDGEHSIRGNPVSLAARMEQSAPPGGLRISQDCWRLVRGLFELQEQPPLRVKGFEEPVQSYLVLGLAAASRSASRRGVPGARAPMLGRQSELAALQAAYAELCSAGTGLLSLSVVAEAGLGKSRLLDEFGQWLASQSSGAVSLQVCGSERHRSQTYGLLRELLMLQLGLLEIDRALPSRRQWLERVGAVLGQPSDAAVLGHLLGIDFSDEAEVHALRNDPRALRDRAFFHAVQVIQQAAAGAAPLILSFDDLHWADEGSLDFIEHLRHTRFQAPLLLILLTRPSLLERRPNWAAKGGEQGGEQRCLHLQPLTLDLRHSLALALLRYLPEVPAGLSQQVADGGEGNPFFMEELINMLIDRGAIEAAGEHWTLRPERLLGLQLPASLQGVLQARLDALAHEPRRALQLASVVGSVFWDRALAVLDELAVSALTELAARELVSPHALSRLQDAREFEFRHPSMHHVAYQSLLKRYRRSAHAALARWLAAQPGAEAMQDQIAEHHERGGDRVLAREAWQGAAFAARARFANLDALAHIERALALTEAHELQQRLTLTLLRLKALESLADRKRLADALQEFQALADAYADAGWLSEAQTCLSGFAFHGGNTELALQHARSAITLAPPNDLVRAARAHGQCFNALVRLGHFDEAEQAAHEALRLAREGEQTQSEAGTLNELGMMAMGKNGDVATATRFWTEALALHRREGHLANEGGTLSNLAFAALSVGDFESARTQFEQARELCERIGQQQNDGIIEINLGLTLLHLALPEQALQHAARALDLLRASGDRWAEAAALRVCGQAELALGRGELARARFMASRDLFDQLNMPHLALEAIAALTAEAMTRAAVAEAMHHAEEILARQARGVGTAGTDEPMRIPLAVWRALKANGDGRADAVLKQAYSDLMARADLLLDPAQRQRFLTAVAPHRDIIAAAAPAAAGPGAQFNQV
jgi:class 3 adenylate cyclase/tetratricopeptide (TPR) repeat protein